MLKVFKLLFCILVKHSFEEWILWVFWGFYCRKGKGYVPGSLQFRALAKLWSVMYLGHDPELELPRLLIVLKEDICKDLLSSKTGNFNE